MRKRILLIDDDVLVLKSTRNLLESRGYDVICAKKFDEAIKHVEESQFDLVISDVRMPGRDGVSTVRQIQQKLKELSKKSIPFIFITGYASEDVPIDAVKLGASDYILKPFDNDQLITAVENGLKSSEKLGAVIDLLPADLCADVKKLIEKYQDNHEEEIIKNKELHSFLSELEKKLDQLEKEFIKNESI